MMRSNPLRTWLGAVRGLAVTLIVCVGSVALAEQYPITVRVRGDSTVSESPVTLADIAIVESADRASDERAIALKRLVVLPHIAPGVQTELSAYDILGRLRGESVDLSTLGYSIPNRITVKRVGRDITRSELQNALDGFLRGTGREVVVRQFSHDGDTRLFAGAASLKVISFERQRVGLSRVILEAHSDSGETVQFSAVGQIDEFMYMPVASRPVPPGGVVGAEDMVMARVDLAKVPRDAAAQPAGVMGHAVRRGLAAGDLFRAPELSLPQDVTPGSAVVLRFVGRGFTATATGTAVDGGRIGGEIRIRNDASRRVVQGIVVEPGLVDVR